VLQYPKETNFDKSNTNKAQICFFYVHNQTLFSNNQTIIVHKNFRMDIGTYKNGEHDGLIPHLLILQSEHCKLVPSTVLFDEFNGNFLLSTRMVQKS
jgi:hypothetical protein